MDIPDLWQSARQECGAISSLSAAAFFHGFIPHFFDIFRQHKKPDVFIQLCRRSVSSPKNNIKFLKKGLRI